MNWLLIAIAAIFLLGLDHSKWIANVRANVLRGWLLVGGAASRTSSIVGSRVGNILLGAVLALLVMNGAKWLPGLIAIDWGKWLPNVPVIVVAPAKVTAVTYVYEKDQGEIPSTVAVALDKLNRQGIMATKFEQDTTDGTGDTPEQYRLALEEAKKVGLPALVVQADKVVVRSVKAPTTEAQVLEAAK